jgi:hypothetical protein
LSDDENLQGRVKDILAGTMAEGPPPLEDVIRQARRLRSRRRLLAGSVALVCAVAVAIPLASLAGLGRREGSEVLTGPLPDVAQVVCNESGTTVLTPKVKPQSDGVHIRIDNQTGRHLGFAFRYEDGGGGGDNAPAGATELIRSEIAPGLIRVGCSRIDPSGPPVAPPTETIDVVDPEAIWVDAHLGCTEVTVGSADYVQGAKGVDDIIQATRDRYQGLRATDVVEIAGYPDAVDRLARVVRDGRVVAVTHFFGDGFGGWLLDQSQFCSKEFRSG